MIYTNYHTHSKWCDGKLNPENYVKEAISRNMYALGFSGHSPVPFKSWWNTNYENLSEYFSNIQNLKKKYEGQIKIYQGMEIDFVAGISGPSYFKNFELDYTIGGVHFLGKFNDTDYFDFDDTPDKFEEGINQLYGGDAKKVVMFYYNQMMKMIETDPPDIIAHLDLILKFNKNNKFFNPEEQWYKNIVFETLEVISKSNCILEMNSRSYFKKLIPHFHPADFIIQRSKELGINFTINADAHKPQEVNSFLKEQAELLQTFDYKEVMIFDEQGWNLIELKVGEPK